MFHGAVVLRRITLALTGARILARAAAKVHRRRARRRGMRLGQSSMRMKAAIGAHHHRHRKAVEADQRIKPRGPRRTPAAKPEDAAQHATEAGRVRSAARSGATPCRQVDGVDDGPGWYCRSSGWSAENGSKVHALGGVSGPPWRRIPGEPGQQRGPGHRCSGTARASPPAGRMRTAVPTLAPQQYPQRRQLPGPAKRRAGDARGARSPR